MPIIETGTAPYAPPSTVISLIERARERGLPSPVTRDVLLKASIGEGLINRVLQALQLLELIDDNGHHTPNLDALRRAPEVEYKARLAELIRAVYAEVFGYVDPSKDPPSRVIDAFRSYEPAGQRSRMVTFFLGMCRAAGIVEGQVRPPADRAGSSTARRPSTKPASIRPVRGAKARASERAGSTTALPAELTALLGRLPDPEKGWPQQRRDAFMHAFGTILDFCYPVREESSNGGAEDQG